MPPAIVAETGGVLPTGLRDREGRASSDARADKVCQGMCRNSMVVSRRGVGMAPGWARVYITRCCLCFRQSARRRLSSTGPAILWDQANVLRPHRLRLQTQLPSLPTTFFYESSRKLLVLILSVKSFFRRVSSILTCRRSGNRPPPLPTSTSTSPCRPRRSRSRSRTRACAAPGACLVCADVSSPTSS